MRITDLLFVIFGTPRPEKVHHKGLQILPSSNNTKHTKAPLGTGSVSKTDEFLEKSKTAFDPLSPLIFEN